MKTSMLPPARTLTLPLFVILMLLAGCRGDRVPPERYSFVIGLKPEKINEYKELHADAWPEILGLIQQGNIRNYSIHLGELEEGKHYLFAYFEYHGKDLEKDMEAMAGHEVMQRWWELTDDCQLPCPTRKEEEFWMKLEEVFYTN